jgi:hypothetical protein
MHRLRGIGNTKPRRRPRVAVEKPQGWRASLALHLFLRAPPRSGYPRSVIVTVGFPFDGEPTVNSKEELTPTATSTICPFAHHPLTPSSAEEGSYFHNLRRRSGADPALRGRRYTGLQPPTLRSSSTKRKASLTRISHQEFGSARADKSGWAAEKPFSVGIRSGALECGSLLPLCRQPACWRAIVHAFEMPRASSRGGKRQQAAALQSLARPLAGAPIYRGGFSHRPRPRAADLL